MKTCRLYYSNILPKKYKKGDLNRIFTLETLLSCKSGVRIVEKFASNVLVKDSSFYIPTKTIVITEFSLDDFPSKYKTDKKELEKNGCLFVSDSNKIKTWKHLGFNVFNRGSVHEAIESTSRMFLYIEIEKM